MAAQSLSRSASQLAKPNLLLSFDAFGTLFSPKDPVAHQYLQEARQFGLTGFSEEELASKLYAAFKDESKLNPNYGKATGLGATKWWTNIIHKTFTPLLPKDKTLPPNLVPRLIERFGTDEAYSTEPSLVSTLKSLRQQPTPQQKYDKIVIGVVSNSDDRVPGILSSFGLKISPLRHGAATAESAREQDHDIDFHCMSYDVGVEKPDRQMFQSAELMLSRIIAAREGKQPTDAEMAGWHKVHVGDEMGKDVVGAKEAGWDSVLLDVNGENSDAVDLGARAQEDLRDVFGGRDVVRSGALHIKPGNITDFMLLSPLDPFTEMGDYLTNDAEIHFFFCKVCGVRCFSLYGNSETAEVDLAELGVAGYEAGKLTRVWRATGGVAGTRVLANALTIDAGQEGLGFDLRVLTEKKQVKYVDTLPEKVEDSLPGRWDRPHHGGCY
ncbi:hypothetical protein K4F52_007953 [Lecanicillium sp. MT-2017a]|nr:hypothetical protein K4F52_007953 [Lecanicillium sp. MT-2017a]